MPTREDELDRRIDQIEQRRAEVLPPREADGRAANAAFPPQVQQHPSDELNRPIPFWPTERTYR